MSHFLIDNNNLKNFNFYSDILLLCFLLTLACTKMQLNDLK